MTDEIRQNQRGAIIVTPLLRKALSILALVVMGLLGGSARAAELFVINATMSPGTTGGVIVAGTINGESTFGVTIIAELIPRGGNIGTVTFTPAPPIDITQAGDPWPGAGTFTPFDSDAGGTGSALVNGSVDDNGTFIPGAATFSGALSSFPIVASANAGGVWDVVLSTSGGDSGWEGLPTTLRAGTITVTPDVSLTVGSFAMPPSGVRNLIVSGNNNGRPVFGVTILLEMVPRAGATGTLTFTPAPPGDIVQLGDPWPSVGTFTAFDTDAAGLSLTQNGSVDDNGTFIDGAISYSGGLSAFPVVASSDADGTWDVTLTTSAGTSGWDSLAGVATVLVDGTITVTAGACLADANCDDGNQCTSDVCNAGFCENTNRTGACTDGNACTVGDACAAGVCVSGTTVDCSTAGNQCNTASCDPSGVEGNCAILSPRPDGVACADGNACSQGDTCQGGACLGGPPVDCSGAGDQCNSAACDPAGADGNCAVFIPILDGTPCNDGNRCSIGEACQSGACVGGSPVDCSGVGGQCNTALCDPAGAEGNCATLIPLVDGTACDDGNACTQGESCQSGTCTNGVPVDCSPLSTQCRTVTCDPAGTPGNCDVVTPQPDGTTCDDGLFCTMTDQCAGGFCAGTGNPCTTGVCDEATDSCAECLADGDCDDANICTDDACITRTCFRTNNSIPCSDGSACTSGDACAGGVCTPGSSVNCGGASDQCNIASCDPAGAPNNCAILTPRPNGTACSDNNRCTNSDSCQSGVCTGTPVNCTSLDTTCSLGVCNTANGTCTAVPRNEGSACNDGLACTTGDACVNGTCRGTLTGSPVVNLSWSPSSPTVSVGQTVQLDLRAASGTCANQPVGSVEVVLNWNPALVQLVGKVDPPSSPWQSSGFPNDSALDGLNAPYTGIPNNDGNAWYHAIGDFQVGVDVPPAGMVVTSFTFQGLDGTLATPVAMIAATGNYSRTRVLGAGATMGVDLTGSIASASVRVVECSTNGDCNDNNVCTTDTCSSGICQYSNNTLSCNDGLFCTATDTCSGGVCVGSGARCSAPQFCSETLDACVECLNTGHCDDGNVCTTDACTASGTCQRTNNTLTCSDGLFCTTNDRCNGGACVGGVSPCGGTTSVCDEAGDRCVQCLSPTQCNDNNACTTDSCTNNVCVNANNTLSCNDNLFCTVTDVCSNGSCVGSGTRCTSPPYCHEGLDACVNCLVDGDCNDSNICTTDVCNASGNCQYFANSNPCDDGLFCTTTDTCVQGLCQGGGPVRCPGLLCDEAGDRCVQCFTLADCANDNITCTVDSCTNGQCLHAPNNAACDNGVFCDGAEFCNTTVGCVQPGNPCDDPLLCDEVNNRCGCQTPFVDGEGSRFLAVGPRSGQTPVALVVTGVSPEVACLTRYVQANGTLGSTPVFRPPTGPNGWNTAHVFGNDIRPSTTYAVQAECDTGNGIGRSPAVQGTTWKWGDTDNSGGLVNMIDVVYIADGFRGVFTQRTLYNVELWGTPPNSCQPQLTVDITDITAGLDAFRQFPFPCARPCP
jgi:hypothetical protein